MTRTSVQGEQLLQQHATVLNGRNPEAARAMESKRLRQDKKHKILSALAERVSIRVVVKEQRDTTSVRDLLLASAAPSGIGTLW